MTITINYMPQPAPGYTPRKAVTLFNVESVTGAGPRMVKVRMMFADNHTTHDHVASVSVKPDTEE